MLNEVQPYAVNQTILFLRTHQIGHKKGVGFFTGLFWGLF